MEALWMIIAMFIALISFTAAVLVFIIGAILGVVNDGLGRLFTKIASVTLGLGGGLAILIFVLVAVSSLLGAFA